MTAPPPVTEEMIEAGYEAARNDGLTGPSRDCKRLVRLILETALAARSNQEATPPIILEMAAADNEAQMWERRFAQLRQAFPIKRIFTDSDGRWGLRDFLDYAAQICGFDGAAKPAQEATRTVGDAE
jgi:hypothetical protein